MASLDKTIYGHLIQTAKDGNTITYGVLADKIGLFIDVSYHRSRLFRILDDINRDEHRAGRPMLSSIVVSSETGMPGQGYFRLARNLGRHRVNMHDRAFWQEEVNRVFNYWKDGSTN